MIREQAKRPLCNLIKRSMETLKEIVLKEILEVPHI